MAMVQAKQIIQTLRRQARDKVDTIPKGQKSYWEQTYQATIDGQDLYISYKVEMYNGYGSKGFTGSFYAKYGKNTIRKELKEVDDIGNAIWGWIKSWFS